MTLELHDILLQLQPISLDEMDSVKLLNRSDTKYVFPASKLPAILEKTIGRYRVLHINNEPLQSYHTTYFDTEDKRMYVEHHNKRKSRYKVRHRTYLSTMAEYLEVKFKTNKGITKKKRTKTPFAENLTESAEFLAKHCPYTPADLLPTTTVNYSRITLVDLANGERATVDINLLITNYDTKQEYDFSHVCIIELKRDKSAQNSMMKEIITEFRIRKQGMSKYAVGTAVVNEDIKKNRFKKKLRLLEKYKQI